jgi:hypothetical protein
MEAASRPYALAAAVLAATSAVAAIPAASRPFQLPIRSIETRLVDADSVLNIPVNLFDDIVNIPYNEVQALDTGAGSLFDTGTWWVPSATNVWGVDTGDITHVAGVLAFALPFPSLDEGLGGLDYQVDGLLAAELPASASCDAQTCAPIVPPDEITGSTSIDRTIDFLETLTGQTQFGLFDSWFQVPLSELLSGYTFTEADDPGVIDPSGPTTQGFGFPLDGGSNPFEGGTGADNAFPWDGLTYTLNPLQPFENFYDSLLATPSTSGIDGTGIELPTFTEILDGLQNGAAGLVIDFDPFTEGSPACAAACDIPESLTIPAIVQDIENLNPSNTTIPTWLAEYAAGTADEPTQSQIDDSLALLQTGIYNLSPEQLATVDADLASVNPELPFLFTNAGILTDPGYVAFLDDPGSTFDPVYGGDNYNLVAQDLLTLLTNNDTNFAAVSNIDTLWTIIDPVSSDQLTTDLGNLLGSSMDAGTLSTDLSNLLGSSVDPTTLATDLSSLLASFGTTLPTDISSLLLSMF